MNERTCEICGTPLSGRSTRYCSRACGIKGNTIARAADPERMARHMVNKARWQRENAEKQRQYHDTCRRETRTCSECGEEYTTLKGYAKVTCSPICAEHRRSGEWPMRPLLSLRGQRCRIHWATCGDCGRVFVNRVGYPLCPSCIETHVCTSRHKWKISRARRLAIYERDNWTCQMCGEPVDRALDAGDDWAASLDHIIARVHGGRHEDANLRLAHRWCNSVVSHGLYYTEADLRRIA